MPFTFEVHFTGLNVFLIQPGAKPEEPSSVEVVMVNATDHSSCHHHHEPVLAYRPENHTIRHQLDPLAPDAIGEQTAVRSLREVILEIDLGVPPGAPNDSLPAPSPLNIESASPETRILKQDQDLGFGLVPSLGLLDIEAEHLKDEVLSDHVALNGPVIARVRLPQFGRLTARKVARDRHPSARPLIFDFLKEDNTEESPAPFQSIADFVTLRIENVQRRVRLLGANEDIRLEPNGAPGPVRISITNLPPKLGSSADPPTQLAHFQCFYDLVRDLPVAGQRVLPVSRRLPATANNGFCPNARIEVP